MGYIPIEMELAILERHDDRRINDKIKSIVDSHIYKEKMQNNEQIFSLFLCLIQRLHEMAVN